MCVFLVLEFEPQNIAVFYLDVILWDLEALITINLLSLKLSLLDHL